MVHRSLSSNGNKPGRIGGVLGGVLSHEPVPNDSSWGLCCARNVMWGMDSERWAGWDKQVKGR